MDIKNLHPWNVTVDQALGIQAELARQVALQNVFDEIDTIAGADVALDIKAGIAHAAVVLYSYPGLAPIEAVVAKQKIRFPYVPGLLSFREGPVLAEAFERLEKAPDLIFFDGQGVAHPRRLGIASHFGLLLNRPTIGCAKSRLVGTHKQPGNNVGDVADLIVDGRLSGYVLRTKPGTLPVFVSPGHRLDYDTAAKLTRTCIDGFRIPKPTRQADALADAAKTGKVKEYLK